jgi:capsid protein
MSRKSRRNRNTVSTSRRSADIETSAAVPMSGFGNTGYQGAGFSPNRGYVYWPTMDPRREINSFTRLELARRVHFLCANVGFPRRILEGLTNLIVGSGLTPQAMTTDQAWNELAEASYKRRANSALTYDVAGRLTAGQAQRLMVKTRLRDGDAGIVFSSSQTGAAMRAFYSGLQVGNAGGRDEDGKRVDGLRTDSLGRVMDYRLLSHESDSFTDIEAKDMCWLVRYDAPGQLRGVSILAHAINKLVDITEIQSAMTSGIKVSSQIGYYVAQAMGAPSSGGMLNTLKGQSGAGANTAAPNVEAIMERTTGGSLVELPQGQGD